MNVLTTSQIQDNYRAVHDRVLRACHAADRDERDVLLLPVSKLHPPAAIEALYELGIRDFGESRVQELLKKRERLPADIRWHFIGNLQSNKVRQIVDVVHVVHSVHSLGLAEELSKRASQPIDGLLEVNISGEASKDGVAPREALPLLRQIEVSCPNLRIIGLMGMASYEEDAEKTRPQFRILAKLLAHLGSRGLKSAPHVLSMGMTNDYEIAIAEGSTIVRVGSAIFGEREH